MIIERKWRKDLNCWETKKRILFVNYYVYSIWDKGKLQKSTKLFKKRNAKYFTKPVLNDVVIGRKDFKEKYQNNPYLVPINYKVNLNKE